jgi:hypothetical protein
MSRRAPASAAGRNGSAVSHETHFCVYVRDACRRLTCSGSAESHRDDERHAARRETKELSAPESGLATFSLKDGTEIGVRPTILDSKP